MEPSARRASFGIIAKNGKYCYVEVSRKQLDELLALKTRIEIPKGSAGTVAIWDEFFRHIMKEAMQRFDVKMQVGLCSGVVGAAECGVDCSRGGPNPGVDIHICSDAHLWPCNCPPQL